MEQTNHPGYSIHTFCPIQTPMQVGRSSTGDRPGQARPGTKARRSQGGKASHQPTGLPAAVTWNRSRPCPSPLPKQELRREIDSY